jgi:threonine/homoserine/homoserine lactone efflux protein
MILETPAASFGLIALAFLVVTASPGPANLACAAVAMSEGRRAGLRMALGLALGLSVWGLAAVAGLGTLLSRFEGALVVLKLFGAAYLLWLAMDAARSATRVTPPVLPVSGRSRFRRGLILNLSNPKAVFAWMAALSMGLEAEDGLGPMLLAALLCMGLGVVNYLLWAVVFSTRPAMRAYDRMRGWIEWAVAGLFAIAGLGLLRAILDR